MFNPGEGLERIEVKGKDIASLYPQPEGEMPEKLDWNSLSDAVKEEAKESVHAEVRECVDPALQEGLDTLKDVSATLTEMGELLRSLKESAGPSELGNSWTPSRRREGRFARGSIVLLIKLMTMPLKSCEISLMASGFLTNIQTSRTMRTV